MSLGVEVIVGNPPYQEDKQDTSDKPIYNDIMDFAYCLSSKCCFISPGRFLFNAGKTPKDWNFKMLGDKHLKVTSYYNNSKMVFPNVGFKGGVAITLRDLNQDYGEIGFYSEYEELNSIYKKVRTINDGMENLSSIVYLQNKFNLDELYKDYPLYRNIVGSNGKEKRLTTKIFTQLDLFTENPIHEDDICIMGLIDNKRVYRFVPSKYIENHDNTDCYKVLLPKSNGTGELGEVLSSPLVSEPKNGYTQSFIAFGAFPTSQEAESVLKYIKTKFARTMLGMLKVTQDNNKDVWKYVPLQDFSSHSDVEWSKSIAEIDKQLYNKYNLSKEEIAFIESMIKPME